MSRVNYIIEVSPYMSMVCAHLEYMRINLKMKGQERLQPFYQRVFRTTMEVYQANGILVDSFELHEHPDHWEIKINGEMAIIDKEVKNV